MTISWKYKCMLDLFSSVTDVLVIVVSQVSQVVSYLFGFHKECTCIYLSLGIMSGSSGENPNFLNVDTTFAIMSFDLK